MTTMPLNLKKAENFVSLIKKFKAPDAFCEDSDAIDHYLDGRDSAPFDSGWVTANAALQDMLATVKSKTDLAQIHQLQEKGAKRFYLAVIRQTGHPDLAAYASEDVELILGFLAAEKENAFADALKTAYERGQFPGWENSGLLPPRQP
jgi:hypothetical protein